MRIYIGINIYIYMRTPCTPGRMYAHADTATLVRTQLSPHPRNGALRAGRGCHAWAPPQRPRGQARPGVPLISPRPPHAPPRLLPGAPHVAGTRVGSHARPGGPGPGRPSASPVPFPGARLRAARGGEGKAGKMGFSTEIASPSAAAEPPPESPACPLAGKPTGEKPPPAVDVAHGGTGHGYRVCPGARRHRVHWEIAPPPPELFGGGASAPFSVGGNPLCLPPHGWRGGLCPRWHLRCSAWGVAASSP